MKAIAVDPGKTTGIAIAVDGELTELITSDFWGAIDIIASNPDALVVVELPANKSVYHKGAKNRGAIERTGVNVGSVIREAELIIKYLHRDNRQYMTKKPSGKVDAKKFMRITGWQGGTNQHVRDAAMMVFKLKPIKK